MTKKKIAYFLFSLTIIAALVLAGCAKAPTATPAPTVTATVTAKPAPAPTVTTTATATATATTTATVTATPGPAPTVTATATATVTATPAPTVGKPIKVGLLADLTGWGSYIGPGTVNGAMMAKEEINKLGGVLGRPIELIVKDTKCDPAAGAQAAKQLILEDKVEFLVGEVYSNVSLAITAVSEEFKIPFLNSTSVTDKLTEANFQPYYFRVQHNAVIVGKLAADVVKSWPGTKLFTIGADFEYPHSVIDNFIPVIQKLRPDIQVVGQLWPANGETEFTPYLTKMAAAKPDIIMNMLEGTMYTAYLRQAKPYGIYTTAKEINGNGSAEEEYTKQLGKDYPDKMITTFATGVSYYPDTPQWAAFKKLHQDTFGKPLGSYVMYSYTVMRLLIEGIKKAGTTDANAFVKAAEGLTFDYPLGKITVRPYDHQGNASWIWGTMGFTAQSPDVAVMTNPGIVQVTEAVMHTPDEIKAIRQKAGNKYLDWPYIK